MTELIYSIGGVIFIILLLPIMQDISDVIHTLCEVIRAKMSVWITKSNVEITELNNKMEGSETNLIGFQTPNDNDTYDDDDDDDSEYEDKCVDKRKVGFKI